VLIGLSSVKKPANRDILSPWDIQHLNGKPHPNKSLSLLSNPNAPHPPKPPFTTRLHPARVHKSTSINPSTSSLLHEKNDKGSQLLGKRVPVCAKVFVLRQDQSREKGNGVVRPA
jgi:hypothetical protein